MPDLEQPTEHQTAFAEMWDGICTLALLDIGPAGKTIKGSVWDSRDLLGKQWRCWINATDQGQKVGNCTQEIRPFEMYVEFNGWPAGIVDPHDGVIAAGEEANVFTFRDAVKRAIMQAKGRELYANKADWEA